MNLLQAKEISKLAIDHHLLNRGVYYIDFESLLLPDLKKLPKIVTAHHTSIFCPLVFFSSPGGNTHFHKNPAFK